MLINEIITEAVGGNYLYHGMSYSKALDVFYSDTMPAKFAHKFPIFSKSKELTANQTQTVMGNSFTRNKNLAWDYVQLTVDRNILAQHNKIVPLDGQLVNDFKNSFAFHKSVDNRFKSNIVSARKYDPATGQMIPTDYRKWDYDRGMPGDALSEEFVIGDIKNIHRCIVKIELINPKWDNSRKGRADDPITLEKINRLVRSITAYGQHYNIPVEFAKVAHNQ